MPRFHPLLSLCCVLCLIVQVWATAAYAAPVQRSGHTAGHSAAAHSHCRLQAMAAGAAKLKCCGSGCIDMGDCSVAYAAIPVHGLSLRPAPPQPPPPLLLPRWVLPDPDPQLRPPRPFLG